MARAQSLLVEHGAPYATDFAQWSSEQAALAREKRFGEIDWPNVIEELESLGSEQRHALTSSYRVLLVHLLKWAHQPGKRTRSWRTSIVRERGNIEAREKTNRSLAAAAEELVHDAYRRARKEAAVETGLPLSTFPAECPYTVAELRDDDFIPE